MIAHALTGYCGALCLRLWSNRLYRLCATGGHVLLQPDYCRVVNAAAHSSGYV